MFFIVPPTFPSSPCFISISDVILKMKSGIFFMHAGNSKQSASAQSVAPSQSLSFSSVQFVS